MSKIFTAMKSHASLIPAPKRGLDTFSITLPEGETFHSCRLTLHETRPGAGAKIKTRPATNATGPQPVSVEWWHTGGMKLRYELEGFATPAGSTTTLPPPTAKMTGFEPARHGFHFNNAFPTQPQIQLNTPFGRIKIGDAKNGLCGGMVFAALDYFHASQPIPETKKPPTGDLLFNYIVKRLYDSFNLPFGISNYIELMQPDLPEGESGPNAFGRIARRRAWKTIREEWPIIKTLLDAGQPCPLGLVRVESPDLRKLVENHQVLAYGYDITGDQLTLFIYDPNYQDNNHIRITLDLSNPEQPAAMKSSTGEKLYALFHIRYRFNPPPAESATQGRILIFEKRDFEGKTKDIAFGSPNLSFSEDGFFDDQVSSFIIASGNWMFFKDSGFRTPYLRGGQPLVLGPGRYPSLEALGLPDNDISSLKAVNLPVMG